MYLLAEVHNVGEQHSPPPHQNLAPLGAQVAIFYYAWLVYCKRNTMLEIAPGVISESKIPNFPGGACCAKHASLYIAPSPPQKSSRHSTCAPLDK